MFVLGVQHLNEFDLVLVFGCKILMIDGFEYLVKNLNIWLNVFDLVLVFGLILPTSTIFVFQKHFLILFLYVFYYFGRRETKKDNKNTYLPLLLTGVGYERQTELISSG